jgi:tetratricopeptide (TPR) repeat protein
MEHRIPNALVSYLTYLWKLIWPTGLAIYYPPRKAISTELLVAALLILLLLSFLSLRSLRKRPYLPVGWFWYLGTLVPVIGFVQVGLQAMADRYTYIPSIGLFIALTWGFSNSFGIFRSLHSSLFTLHSSLQKWLVPTFSCAVLIACGIATSAQARVWENSVTLYRHALAVTSNNAVAHYNLNSALIQDGHTDEAITLASSIDNPIIYLNLGSALLEQGRLDEAIQQFAAAVRVHPTYTDALSNWGFALALQGKLDEAIAKYRQALALKPNVPQTHHALGEALLRQNKRDDAIAEFKAAIEVSPDYPAALNDLAWVLATDPDPQVRNGVQAVGMAERACQVTAFQEPQFIGTLAAAYAEVGRFNDAVKMAEQAKSLAAAQGKGVIVERNQQLLELYRAGKPYHNP